MRKGEGGLTKIKYEIAEHYDKRLRKQMEKCCVIDKEGWIGICKNESKDSNLDCEKCPFSKKFKGREREYFVYTAWTGPTGERLNMAKMRAKLILGGLIGFAATLGAGTYYLMALQIKTLLDAIIFGILIGIPIGFGCAKIRRLRRDAGS